ncbi:MAG: hypothetical protein PHD82_15405 [Candidatus Riflebacteria bacterium]|nr:hypothetical protein [Candidatus Riflebacteria bacterium]
MKVCSKCGKNFPDGVKLCPFDRTPLESGEGQPRQQASETKQPAAASPSKQPSHAGHAAAAQTSAFSDANFPEMELAKDGQARILVPSRTLIHSIFGFGIVIGAVMLFMVVASVTGLGSRRGSAAPSMETSTAVIMSVLGAFFLGSGLGLRNLFQHYSVIDLKKRKLLRMTRIQNKIIEENAVVDLGNIKEFKIKSRTANVTADTILSLITSFFKKKQVTNELLQSQDFSLIALMKDGKEIEISAFANGEHASVLAERRKSFLTGLLLASPPKAG